MAPLAARRRHYSVGRTDRMCVVCSILDGIITSCALTLSLSSILSFASLSPPICLSREAIEVVSCPVLSPPGADCCSDGATTQSERAVCGDARGRKHVTSQPGALTHLLGGRGEDNETCARPCIEENDGTNNATTTMTTAIAIA
ncbi:hypothetical protein AAHC03_0318 [Spirometra sp. Aus1]